MKMEYDVFISYSRKDIELAEMVAASLKKLNLSCFLDRETIEFGADWREKIGKSLYYSELVLLIWTASSNQSDNVAREVVVAEGYGKTIIPFRVGDFVPHYRLAYALALNNRVEGRQGISSLEIEQFATSIARSVETARTNRLKKEAEMEAIEDVEHLPSKSVVPHEVVERVANAVNAVVKEKSEVDTSQISPYEAEYKLGCEMFRKYRLDEAFELLLEAALENYREAQKFVYYCVASDTRCFKIKEQRFLNLIEREDVASNDFALFLISRYYLFKNDYAKLYDYAVKSMTAGSDYGAMQFIRCYEFGMGVEKNFEKILPRLRKLALEGNAWAQYIYGRNLIYGWSCAKQPALGVKFIEEGAAQGDLHCMNALAVLYRYGECVDADADRAKELYLKLVELGYVEAYESLGTMALYNADGTIKDAEQAIQYYAKGAELNVPDCMETLGVFYETGANGKKNINLAMRWYNRAATCGSRFAYYCLGRLYYWGEDGLAADKAKAWDYFERGAKRYNSWDSYYMLAEMYYAGDAPDGVTAQDAVRYYEECIFGGSSMMGESASRLYDIYHEGKDVPQDEQKGIDFLIKAAEQGYEEAMLKVGKVLTADIMSPYADEVKGIKYLTQAYEKGNVEAAIVLAELYRNGMATVRNIEKSKEFLQFAINKEENTKALCEMGKLFAHTQQPGWDENFNDEDIPLERKRIEQKIAIDYLTRAGEKGCAEAYSCLVSVAIDIAYSDDVSDAEGDEMRTKAYGWAKAGAALDHAQSHLDLAVFYQCGVGCKEDFDKAEEHYKRAVELGSAAAPASLAILYDENPDRYADKLSDAYYYEFLSRARGHSGSNIETMENHRRERIAKLESIKEGYDIEEFCNRALPRRLALSPSSTLTLAECSQFREIINNLIDSYNNARNWPSLEGLMPKRYDESERLIDFVDDIRVMKSRLWLAMRSRNTKFAELSILDQSELIDVIEHDLTDESLQLGAISIVEMCIYLRDLYDQFKDSDLAFS